MALPDNNVMANQRTREEKELLRRFGDHLRTLRISRGITQEALAEDAGFSRSYYTEIETGKRNVSLLNLRKIAKALKTGLGEIVDIEL